MFDLWNILLFRFSDAKIGNIPLASKKNRNYFQENPKIKPPRVKRFPKFLLYLFIYKDYLCFKRENFFIIPSILWFTFILFLLAACPISDRFQQGWCPKCCARRS